MSNPNKNSVIAQRKRLLERLHKQPCTTIQARHELDVLQPAPRVFELRHNHGYNIVTHWCYEKNPGGGSHRIARYTLLPGTWDRGVK